MNVLRSKNNQNISFIQGESCSSRIIFRIIWSSFTESFLHDLKGRKREKISVIVEAATAVVLWKKYS